MSRKTLFQLGPPEHRGDAFSRRHPPMPVRDRAKIFAPFAALPPYAKALTHCREKAVLVKPPEISEDAAAQINGNLKKLLFLLKNNQKVPVDLAYFVFTDESTGYIESCRAHIIQADAAAQTLTFIPRNQDAACTISFKQLCRLELD